MRIVAVIFIASMSLVILNGCAESRADNAPSKSEEALAIKTVDKMKVEIWSDIMCPFCYIGKRHYEEALKQFADANNIEVEWKSFQLDPTIPKPYTEGKNMYQYLADSKGMSLEQSKQLHTHVVEMAAKAGLKYDFDKAVVANSWDAHRVIQYAKTKGKGDAIEERFFKAYFTEGRNMADAETLIELAGDIGLDKDEVKLILDGDEFSDEVRADIHKAQVIGVSGVPFFVFNDRYGVSGAQPVEVFTETLQKSFEEWRKENPETQLKSVIDGPVCTPDGECK